MRSRRRAIAAILSILLAAAACSDSDTSSGATNGSLSSVGSASTTTPASTTLSGASVNTATPTAPPPTVAPTTTPPAAPGSLDALRIRARRVATANAPIVMATRTGRRQIWVAERAGRVRVFDPANGSVGQPIVDISANVSTNGERGLLGLAFSPDGTKLYLSYTNSAGDTRIDEFTMRDDDVDTNSRRTVFALKQPFSNHNGGNILFGPDGFLWIGLGDGGSQNDPSNNGQNTDALLASMLRIDPSKRTSGEYGIPADNPFVSGGGQPEIWMKGLRNPWRYSFDRATGDLWIGDVGGGAVEEIDIVRSTSGAPGRGANFEWPLYEGTRQNKGARPPGGVGPIYEYGHSNGNCSVTGGYVYRGEAYPTLRGVYIFGDYCRSEIQLLRYDGNTVTTKATGVTVDSSTLASFGEGPDGELYALSLSGGIFRIEVI